MEDNKKVLDVLKKVLKSKGITYFELGDRLGLSEATIKRLFSNGDMSLSRLNEVCSVVEVSLLEIVQTASSLNESSYHCYTLEQEKVFSRKPALLALFDNILNGSSLKEIKEKFGLNWTFLRSAIKELEQLELLELHENDRVKLLIPRQVKWREDGPLRKKLLPKALSEFLNSSFSSKMETRSFQLIELSEASIRRFEVELEKIQSDAQKTSSIEKSARIKCYKTGVLVALRKWDFSELSNFNI